MAKRECRVHGKYALTFGGVRKALRRQGGRRNEYGASCETHQMDSRERKAASRFVAENASRSWCISKWRQEIGIAIGRNCHTIPFDDVRGVLAAERIKPTELRG